MCVVPHPPPLNMQMLKRDDDEDDDDDEYYELSLQDSGRVCSWIVICQRQSDCVKTKKILWHKHHRLLSYCWVIKLYLNSAFFF